ILGLELTDFYGTVNEFIDNTEAEQSSRIKPGTKLISIGTGDVFIHANFQDFQRYQPVDVSLAADAEATLPLLVEHVKSEITPARVSATTCPRRWALRWRIRSMAGSPSTFSRMATACMRLAPFGHPRITKFPCLLS